MSRFDPLSVPLDGVQLLEASAGTGKTHSLADLHVRLLLERADLEVTHILVVTFTNAAAAELRERLLARLQTAAAAVGAAEAGKAVGDPIVTARLAAGDAPGTLRDRLRRALADYDRAPVCTIHSFCQRVLRERVFECGTIPNAELAPSSADLLERVAREFLRARVRTVSGPAAGRLLAAVSADEFATIAGIAGGAEDYVVEPDPSSAPDLAGAARSLEQAAAALRAGWDRERSRAERLLRDESVMSQTKYKSAKVPLWFDLVGAWAARPFDLEAPLDELGKLSQESVSEGVKKDCPAPRSPLFAAAGRAVEAVAAFDEAVEETVAAWRAEFARRCRAMRRELCDRLDLRAFDDLIALVRDALRGRQGNALARALGRDYPVALIDEFQDTDPAQYEIFRALRDRGGATLVLIGDPKQSIYAFRGADIFAYGRAAARAKKHALTENWRSTPGLLDAVNAIFRRPRSFLLDFIAYEKVVPAQRPHVPRLTRRGEPQAPFGILLDRPPPEGGAVWNKGEAGARVCAAVAAEIVELLDPASGYRIADGKDGSERPPAPADVAVLVSKNAQAAQVRAALEAVGVPSVLSSREGVYASDEAGGLWSLLHALARPRDAALLRGVALLPVIGWTPADLARAEEDPARWDALFDRWQRHHERWSRRGFARMFHPLLAAEGTVERLLAGPDGPRRVTNLRHLGELLAEAEAERHLGPAALADWLGAQIRAGATDEAAELRLESDADRVRVATIHASKGLQYPVVFCPFLWNFPQEKRTPRPPVVCQADGPDGGRVLDAGGPRFAEHVQRRAEEAFQEGVRLCYVALTRAKAACRIAWGPYKDVGRSPMAGLLHPRDVPPAGADGAEEQPAAWDEGAVERDLAQLAKRAKGAIEVRPLEPGPGARLEPERPDAARLTPRVFGGRVDDGWGLSSFTHLHASAAGAAERPDHDDDAPAAAPDTADPEPRFRLPGGPACGNALHAMFEKLDFGSATPESTAELAGPYLRRHGIAASWADTVGRLVCDALDTPLNDRGLRLRDLAAARCLRELAFLHPVARLTPGALARALGGEPQGDAGDDEPPRLTFAPFHGFMKGFIDLVFEWEGRVYLLDYKSNLIGRARDDYAAPRIERAMREADYTLQYRLYCVALRRHWLARGGSPASFARDFGGVFYLFLRGMDPAAGPSRGIFFARPDPERIAALSDLFERGGDA